MSRDAYRYLAIDGGGTMVFVEPERLPTGGGVGTVGPAGPEGPQGPQGDPGPAGPRGDTGPAGPAGSDGAPGADGQEGPAGPAGADGAPGADGATGPQGLQGPRGLPGADSTIPGPEGPQGIQGIQGPAGSQGPAGPQGDPGPQGIPGTNGNSWQFPVGHILISADNVSPATWLGYGTWAQWGQGRFLLGATLTGEVQAGSATHGHNLSNPTVQGEAAHTHTYSQTVNHVHPMQRFPTATGGSTGFTVDTSMSGTLANANDTANPTGGVAQGTTAAGASHTHALSGGSVADGSTDPLSITAFLFKRTA